MKTTRESISYSFDYIYNNLIVTAYRLYEKSKDCGKFVLVEEDYNIYVNDKSEFTADICELEEILDELKFPAEKIINEIENRFQEFENILQTTLKDIQS